MSRIIFVALFSYMALVFGIGVFLRDMVDIWIQLSIYIIPLLSLICGHRIFNSKVFLRLMNRKVAKRSMVSFFIPKSDPDVISPAPAASHHESWLTNIAVKALVFPLLLEIIQWSVFLWFYIHSGGVSFIGNDVHVLEDSTWVLIYCIYWVVALYVVGFVAFQFVFVSRLIIKDTVSLMSLFGISPFLNVVPVYEYGVNRKNPVLDFLKFLVNFVTFDLLETFSDQVITSKFAMLFRSRTKSTNTERKNPVNNCAQNSENDTDNLKIHCDDEEDDITPYEATEVFAGFIFEIEEMTSSFTPFTVSVTFFGVANLITHVCLFATKDGEHIRFWTLCRTFIWLFVSLRMLLCVSQISSVLSKVVAHFKYILAAGKLNRNYSLQEWHEFLALIESFQLGKKSFGFPLTLRQVASIATFLNMSFLIALSVIKPSQRFKDH